MRLHRVALWPKWVLLGKDYGGASAFTGNATLATAYTYAQSGRSVKRDLCFLLIIASMLCGAPATGAAIGRLVNSSFGERRGKSSQQAAG